MSEFLDTFGPESDASLQSALESKSAQSNKGFWRDGVLAFGHLHTWDREPEGTLFDERR
jgi:hypothetical protein